MTLRAHGPALMASAQAWEDASDQVRGARRSLADIDTAVLGDRVAPHAEEFLDTWLVETTRLGTDATDHGEALRDACSLYARADEDTLARNEQLLRWNDRSATPVPGRP